MLVLFLKIPKNSRIDFFGVTLLDNWTEYYSKLFDKDFIKFSKFLERFFKRHHIINIHIISKPIAFGQWVIMQSNHISAF